MVGSLKRMGREAVFFVSNHDCALFGKRKVEKRFCPFHSFESDEGLGKLLDGFHHFGGDSSSRSHCRILHLFVIDEGGLLGEVERSEPKSLCCADDTSHVIT